MIKVKKLTEALNGLISPGDFTADILITISYLSEDAVVDFCKKTNNFKNWIISLIFAICLKKDTLVTKIKSELLKQATADYCKQTISQILSDKKIINKISTLINNNLLSTDKTTFIFDTGQVITLSDSIITDEVVNKILVGPDLDHEMLKYVNIGNNVTSIGDAAFCKCRGLTSITIPDSVISIEDDAFRFCSGLTDMTIGNGVTSIGYRAFWGCNSLRSITIPDTVTSIGYRAFSDCGHLTAVYITDLVAWCNIEFRNYVANPLYYAEKLYLNGKLVTDLVIPNIVTEIKRYAFYNCRGLTRVTIPDSVTSIDNGAFAECNNLTSVTIPDSVTSIGYGAFFGCNSLTSVTIGNSVTSIDGEAFYNCSSLVDIWYNGTKLKWEKIKKDQGWNLNIPISCIIHCSDGDINI